MLRKSLLTALLLFIGYELVVRSNDFWWSTGQNTQQSSVVRAHNFIFAKKKYTNIMVGSSIGNRITSGVPADSLPEGFYNLSFGGQSIFDGMLILRKMDYAPRVLYIEINTLMRNEDPNLQSGLFSPIMYPLKTWFESLREKNQPLGVLARTPKIKEGNPADTKEKPQVYTERKESNYRAMLQIEIQSKKDSIYPAALEGQINKLKEYVTYFQNKGTRIVFFEVPVDPAVCYLASPTQIRNAVHKTFLPMGCRFIDMPDCNLYLTTDATHLERVSVFDYLYYFRKQLADQKILL